MFINYIFLIKMSENKKKGFLLIFKFSENCPKTHREFPEKIIHEFHQKYFPEFYFPKFSENFGQRAFSVLFGS